MSTSPDRRSTPLPPAQSSAANAPFAGVPSDNTTVLAELEAVRHAGFPYSFRPGQLPGTVVCGACDFETHVTRLPDLTERRFEGASDPDDMQLLIVATCPVCGNGGAILLGFGPASSPTDTALVAALPVRH